jgi:hypothetical protein
MKVVSIRSRMLFNPRDPRPQVRVPDGMELMIGVATTHWIPTLLVCFSIRDVLPFFLMLGCEVLGALWGLLIYRLMPDRIPSCVPVSRISKIPERPTRPLDKHAA